ncbi:MAG TPA: DUF1499 domain-containing protein [Myxococcales bacterium]|nr:DUF1499 domain-containing protein [Myxococcales bacterium]
MSDEQSRTASVAYWGSLAAAAAALFGVLGIQLGLLQPLGGFYLFALGTLVGGVFALVMGLAALWTTRSQGPEQGRRPGRKRAWVATATGLVLTAVLLQSALPGSEYPPINDITTDLDDPPEFASSREVGAYAAFDMGYPADFVAVVREGYPDLATLELNLNPNSAYAESLGAARSLGWEITYQDASKGRFDASQTSAVFRFVDDITVRVRPRGSGSEVDIRSRSRVGRGDLGANAARIRRFAEALMDR